MSTIKVTNLRHESATSNNIALDSSNNVTTANNFTAGGTIGCTGDLTVTSGNVVLSSGNGIDFSAAGNASGMTSELLDDYEEGTFTPGIQGTTTGGTATYASAVGTYTKVGRLVTIQAFLQWSSGTGSGAMQITGLPFAAASGNRFYAISVSDSTITTSANHILVGRTENSKTTIILKEEPTGGGSQKNGTYDSAAQVIISCSYHV
jgi:hypothetical protein